MARPVAGSLSTGRFSWFRHGGLILKLLIVAILLAWPYIYPSAYGLRVMTTGGLYTILTVAVVIILGQAGQLSFGHVAFYGIGAYTAAMLTVKLPVPTLAALVIGALVAGLIAFIVGRPVLKLRYFYLALATIGLGQIFLVLVIQLRTITGGATGLAPIPKLNFFGFVLDTNIRQYYLVWIVALVVVLFVDRALKHRAGRALRAIATSEIASSSLGVRTANWKLLAFVTSAVICGLAGGLYAFVTMAVDPRGFTFTTAILPIVMMMLGRRVGLGLRYRGHRHDLGDQWLHRGRPVPRGHLLGHHDLASDLSSGRIRAAGGSACAAEGSFPAGAAA